MGVDETTTTIKSSTTTMASEQEEIEKNKKQQQQQQELEEGEITNDDEDESNSNSNSNSIENININNNNNHELENSWTFWFDSPAAKQKQATWGSSMRPIYTFSSVEHFWGLYNNINFPSKLGLGADLYCFKQNIEPKWEDPVCADGGKWTITYSRGKSDTPWLYTLLAMIGEQFDHGDDICGAVVNVRNRQDKISLWTKNAANESAQLSIGRQWKKFLDWNDTIGFIFHDDAKKLDRNAKNKYSC